jgi:hypothetical protein
LWREGTNSYYKLAGEIHKSLVGVWRSYKTLEAGTNLRGGWVVGVWSAVINPNRAIDTVYMYYNIVSHTLSLCVSIKMKYT